MDFRPPEQVDAALSADMAHGVYGYYDNPASYAAALSGWMERRHNWQVDPSWLLQTHGLVNALALCISAFSNPGEGVIVFSPVYHWFGTIVRANDRRLVESELVQHDGVYHMDLAALEAQLTGDETLVLLCSPHNPGGRVWSAAELGALADFCVKHDLVLVSDEVHNDLIMPGHSHVVAPLAMPQAHDRLVTLVATTKTFNIAGGMTGSMVIPDDTLREKLAKTHRAAGMSVNRFGMVMAEAAYLHGDDWLDALLVYLDGNRQLLSDELSHIPGVSVMPLQSTYLAWVDFAGTGMPAAEFINRIQTAGVAASHGSTFGAGGDSFMRFNIATPRARVATAMQRLRTAFSDLQ
jgi:cystathionine beta-lyase